MESALQKFNEIHHGRNVKRFREMLGIKQEFLADELDYSQQSISRLESQEVLDEDTLNKIAGVLRISVKCSRSRRKPQTQNNQGKRNRDFSTSQRVLKKEKMRQGKFIDLCQGFPLVLCVSLCR